MGVARTKFLAKVASAGAKPDGLLVVPPDGETAFLHPLPVERLWGVGPKTAAKLHARGLTTVGEVALLPEAASSPCWGRRRGGTCTPSHTTATPGPCRAGGGGSRWEPRAPCASPATRPRRSTPASSPSSTAPPGDAHAGRVGRTVTLRLRFADFGPRHPRPHPGRGDRPHADAPRRGPRPAATAMPTIRHRGITLVGISVGNLADDDAVQLALPFERTTAGTLDAARRPAGALRLRRRHAGGAPRA